MSDGGALDAATHPPIPDAGWHGRDGCASLGTGNAPSFSAPIATAVENPGKVVAADFDGDGLADVAMVAGANLDSISVFMGRGDGSFRAPVRYPTPGGAGPQFSQFAPLTLADLDLDGRPDLVSANRAGAVSTLLALRGGTFRSRVQSGPIAGNAMGAPSIVDIAVGDIDGDGIPDLFAAGVASAELKGFRMGSFKLFDQANDTALGQHLSAVVLADFDRNGVIDYAACDVSAGPLAFSGRRDGTFVPFDGQMHSGDCNTILAADLNNDRNQDILLTVGGSVEVLFGSGDGKFSLGPPACVNPDPLSYLDTTGLALADFDGDGATDIPGLAYLDGKVAYVICRGNGDGTFKPPLAVSPTTQKGVRIMVAADFNGDCRPDLLLVSHAPDQVEVVLNTTP